MLCARGENGLCGFQADLQKLTWAHLGLLMGQNGPVGGWLGEREPRLTGPGRERSENSAHGTRDKNRTAI